jgi:hypothetical protein
MANNNGKNGQLVFELADKLPSLKELRSDLVRATFGRTQRADPQGGTPIKSGASTRKYTALSLNPVAKSAIDTLVSTVFSTPWVIKSTVDLDQQPQFEEIDNFLIDFIEANLHNLEYETFDNMMKTIYQTSITYGFGVTEQIWDFDKGFVVLKEMKGKPSFDFDIYMDEFDNVQSIYHLDTGDVLNPEKFILSTYPVLRDGNPYGLSELEAIELDIQTLEELEKIFTLGSSEVLNKVALHYQDITGKSEDEFLTERTAIQTGLTEGGGVIHLPATRNQDTDQLIKTNEIMILEDRASEEALPAVSQRIIELQKRINRNFGIQDNLGQSTVGIGSLAKSKVELSMFMLKVERGAQWIRDIINTQIINRIVEYNYDETELPPEYTPPKWDFQELETEELKIKSDTVMQLLQSGVITKMEAREILELPMIDENELESVPETEEEVTSNV